MSDGLLGELKRKLDNDLPLNIFFPWKLDEPDTMTAMFMPRRVIENCIADEERVDRCPKPQPLKVRFFSSRAGRSASTDEVEPPSLL